MHIEKAGKGPFLVVQWLGLHAFTAQVQSLVGELRSHKPLVCGILGQKKKQDQRVDRVDGDSKFKTYKGMDVR